MKKNALDNLSLPIFFSEEKIPFPYTEVGYLTHEIIDIATLSASENCGNRLFVFPIDDKSGMLGIDRTDVAEEKMSDIFKESVNKIGMICEVVSVEKPERGNGILVTFRGIAKAKALKILENGNAAGTLNVIAEPIVDEPIEDEKEIAVYKRSLTKAYKKYSDAKNAVDDGPDNKRQLFRSRNIEVMLYGMADAVDLPADKQLEIILQDTIKEKCESVIKILSEEAEYLKIEEDIIRKTHISLTEQQKDAFLREQIATISEELGDDEVGDYNEFKAKLEKNKEFMPESTYEKLSKELERMRKIPSMSADYPVSRQHIEFLLDLPWKKTEQQPIELDKIREILDRDHYGLEKVKDRIVEFMAVKTMKNATANSIVCLFGPPGTGKTSIVRSISEALGREYVRISLGGVRDEAEIRGHRKTYVGAMAGRILTAIEKAKTSNPVILLDEIDKLCGDFRGDPASALLEVLDKEQNKEFVDTYAEVPFDLSDVLFITTANSLETIPSPLLDRLEVIELSSYTEKEKTEIAKRHLIPKQAKEHGLAQNSVKFTKEAIEALINEYTQEAGVRNLERQIASVMRKSICLMKKNDEKTVKVTRELLLEMLGAGRAIHRFDTRVGNSLVGTVNGMAWTSIGGVLLSVQVNILEGSGKLEITGLIGDVMKESATAALSYIRSKYKEFGLAPDFYKTKDVHIHLPEGATPKDGPSAGVTLTTAIVSALTDTPVKQWIAMTGEITIRGEVLAIGGLKEKTLAALKEGIKTVIVPAENVGDLNELPEEVKKGLEIITVKNIGEVLDLALDKSKKTAKNAVNA